MLRFAPCLGLMCGLWYALFTWLQIEQATGFAVIAWATLIHFSLLALLIGLRRLRAKVGKWRSERERRKLLGNTKHAEP